MSDYENMSDYEIIIEEMKQGKKKHNQRQSNGLRLSTTTRRI